MAVIYRRLSPTEKQAWLEFYHEKLFGQDTNNFLDPEQTTPLAPAQPPNPDSFNDV